MSLLVQIREATTMVDPDLVKSAPWMGPLSKLTAKLSAEPDWTWITGGCFAFSEALAIVTGCPEYGIIEIASVSEDGAENPGGAHHAMVKIGNSYYDFNGKVNVRRWVNKIQQDRLPDKIDLKIGSREEYDDYWFNDEWLDNSDRKFLITTLKRVLS